MALWVKTIKAWIVLLNLKLNASPRSRSGPPWPVGLALMAAVGLAHLWLLDAGAIQLNALPGPTMSASAILQQPVSLVASPPTPPAPAVRPPPLQKAAPRPTDPDTPAVAAQASIASLPNTASEPVIGSTSPPVAEPTQLAQTGGAGGPTEPVPGSPAAAAEHTPPAAQAPLEQAKDAPPAQPAIDTATPPAAATPAAPVALSIPQSARLNYQVSGRARGFDYTASAQLDWQHDGQRYQSRVVISSFPLPSRSQTSMGELGPQGLSPRRFSDRSRTEVAVHFQPDQGRIVFSNNSPQAPWQAGVQDRLSVLLQLSALIGGDPSRFEPGAKISLPTAGLRDVEPWEFTVLRKDNLSLPIGEHPALLLRREPRHLYDQTLELWFAPSLGHLPVRMTISQANGDRLDQRLASIEKP